MRGDGTFVYLLRSLSNPERYHTGVTSDVARRLRAHNGGLSPHTADAAPWQVVVSIWFADLQRAVAFERYLQSAAGGEFVRRHFR